MPCGRARVQFSQLGRIAHGIPTSDQWEQESLPKWILVVKVNDDSNLTGLEDLSGLTSLWSITTLI
jgi:hypothetical protein